MSKPQQHASAKYFLIAHFRKGVWTAAARQACWGLPFPREESRTPASDPALHLCTSQPCNIFPHVKSQLASREFWFTSYQASFSKAKQNSTHICSSLPLHFSTLTPLFQTHCSPAHLTFTPSSFSTASSALTSSSTSSAITVQLPSASPCLFKYCFSSLLSHTDLASEPGTVRSQGSVRALHADAQMNRCSGRSEAITGQLCLAAASRNKPFEGGGCGDWTRL